MVVGRVGIGPVGLKISILWNEAVSSTPEEVESIDFQATLPDVNNYHHHHHRAASSPVFAWVRRNDLQLKAWSGVGFPDDTSIIIEPFEEKTYVDNSLRSTVLLPVDSINCTWIE
jgi:hypothetical protein